MEQISKSICLWLPSLDDDEDGDDNDDDDGDDEEGHIYKSVAWRGR